MKRILLVLIYSHLVLGASVSSLQQYAKGLPEVPEVSYETFDLEPDYSLWHRKREPSYLTRVLRSIGLFRPVWSPQLFEQHLDAILKQRENRMAHMLCLNPLPHTEFVIVGPVYGAYHSLLRLLTHWVDTGYIDDQFKLIQPDRYIVFTGDVVNGSPYTIETLDIIIQLMLANPDRVIYLAGAQEKNNTWRGHGFKNDLLERTKQGTLKKVSQFFSTLPHALALFDGTDLLMIGTALAAPSVPSQIQPGQLRSCSLAKEHISVSAVITNEKRLMSYAQQPGLVLAPAELGALTWAIFSSPNRVYQKYYEFTHDAYTILTIGTTLDQSTLSLVTQDALTKSGFSKVSRYAVLTGKDLNGSLLTANNPFIPTPEDLQKLKQCSKKSDLSYTEELGPKKAPLYLGCTLDLTKGASPLGHRLRDGITLRVNEINQAGGIQGRPVKVVFMDDGYSPVRARENVLKFMKTYNSKLFISNLGSPTTEFYTDLIEQEKVFVFFPSTGAPVFRKKSMKGVVHWRASFTSEGKALTNFVTKKYGIANIMLLYQDDSFGKGALEGAREIVPNIPAVGYERNVTSFSKQIAAVKASGAGAIGFFSTSAAATEFIRQAGVESFIGKKLFGVSDLAEESFTKFSSSRGLSFSIAEITPNPQTSTLTIAQDFRDVLRKQGGIEGDVFMFEGYISASLAFSILQKATAMTPEAINKVLPTLHTNFKGIPLSFNPDTRELAQLLWIYTDTHQWVRQELS